jgi:putative transposase
MVYRTITVEWRPRTPTGWRTFSAARQEAARLWGDLTERHHRIRRRNLTWPSRARWFRWAKRRYPRLHSQSVQQIIIEFCEAVESAQRLRKNGHDARYPWRRPRYRDVVYTNQAARIRNGYLILPNGASGALKVRLPSEFELPGRLMEVRLRYGRILLICRVPDEAATVGTPIGIDLGVNTLIAATDGETAVLVNGREAKATVQWRNKRLAGISSRQSRKVKGSRRWKQLQRRKRGLLSKARRRLNDLMHKATRQVADAFPNAICYVGRPFNDAAQKLSARNAQTVSQACNAKLIRLLAYKTGSTTEIEEYYSSQTCPVCGGRQKCRRTYRCRCGATAPRDVVGSLNHLSIGLHGHIQTKQRLPTAIKYLRPRCRSSSGGHPACSSSLGARNPRL